MTAGDPSQAALEHFRLATQELQKLRGEERRKYEAILETLEDLTQHMERLKRGS